MSRQLPLRETEREGSTHTGKAEQVPLPLPQDLSSWLRAFLCLRGTGPLLTGPLCLRGTFANHLLGVHVLPSTDGSKCLEEPGIWGVGMVPLYLKINVLYIVQININFFTSFKNWHTIPTPIIFTPLDCSAQWSTVYSHSGATITTISFLNILMSPTLQTTFGSLSLHSRPHLCSLTFAPHTAGHAFAL